MANANLENLEAERTVLGAVLSDNAAMAHVAGVLIPQHFASPAHRRTYEAMLALFQRSDPIDLVTVRNELGADLQGVGGAPFLAALLDGLPRISNPEHWARLVLDKARRRAAVSLGRQLASDATAGELDTIELLEAHQARLMRLLEAREGVVQSLGQIIPEAIQGLEACVNAPDGLTGIPTGIAELDDVTSGLRRGSLFILAARPARGKSSLCTQVALNAAVRGHRVLVFSMEMPPPEVVQRMLLGEARLSQWDLRCDRTGSAWRDIAEAAGKLGPLPIRFDRRESPTLAQIRAACRQEHMGHGVDFVVVDYIQRCSLPAGVDQWIGVGEIAKGLKSLARSLNIPVLAACQLGAEAEEKRPTMAHLAQSRQVIGAEADIIAFLHPEEDDWRTEDAPQINLLVDKHRHGATASIPLVFEKRFTRFRPMSDEWRAA